MLTQSDLQWLKLWAGYPEVFKFHALGPSAVGALPKILVSVDSSVSRPSVLQHILSASNKAPTPLGGTQGLISGQSNNQGTIPGRLEHTYTRKSPSGVCIPINNKWMYWRQSEIPQHATNPTVGLKVVSCMTKRQKHTISFYWDSQLVNRTFSSANNHLGSVIRYLPLKQISS